MISLQWFTRAKGKYLAWLLPARVLHECPTGLQSSFRALDWVRLVWAFFGGGSGFSSIKAGGNSIAVGWCRVYSLPL
ncbi:MAG: hypothetical protein FWG12_00165 [Holophagaceae bacterium]|nr:hypothetical protein [Holophagaceae bacterium]